MITPCASVILPAADALPLPAPAVVMHILLLFTFYLHLLAMNAMLGGLIITLWARWRSHQAGDRHFVLADSVAGTTPSLVAATVTLGVAPLLFLQTLMGQFFFTSSILMGWSWFSVVVVLIFAYYGTYLQSFQREKLGSARTPLLMVTSLLFLWVALMFSNNTSLMVAVQTWAPKYFADPRGLHLNLGDPTLPPRFLHAVLGAVAVAGLFLSWWGKLRLKGGDPSGTFMIHTGLTFFSWITAVNLLIGLWYLMALPEEATMTFMGRDIIATILLLAGIVLALIMVTLGFRNRARATEAGLWPLTLMTAVVLMVMVLTRDTARRTILGDLYQPATFPVKTQALNLALFAVLMVGGVMILVWMIRELKRSWA